MFLERTSDREFTQAVSNHVLRDEDGVENLAVVHVEGVSHKLRRDRRTTRPSLDRLLRVRRVELRDLLEEMPVHKRAFFDRSSHRLLHFHWPTVTADQDEPIRRLPLRPGLIPLGDDAPRRHGMPATRGLAGATTHRVIYRILGNPTAERTNATVARTPCFTEDYILMLDVADLTNSRVTVLVNPADLTRGEADLRVAVVHRHDDRRTAGTSHHLGTPPGSQLQIVNGKPDRDGLQRKAVTHLRGRLRPADNSGSDLQSVGGDDITFLTVFVLHEGQTGRANRILLDRDHLRLDSPLIPLEIDDTNLLLVSLPDSSTRHATIGIPPSGFLAAEDQVLLRPRLGDLLE